MNVGHRRVPTSVQRQAISISLISVALVTLSTYALLTLTPYALDQVLFEVVSAFATVGLSTGITADVGAAGHVLLMFVGRIGPLTVGSVPALKDRTRHYELPEERLIVGRERERPGRGDRAGPVRQLAGP